jgi:16S rRNA (cytidine1402-2'-O)-methyltransferase
VSTLYVVATPIGNLEDITLRALRILSEAYVIAAEDTRTTRKLLSHHGIRARLISYNEHNMKKRTPSLLHALDKGDIAIVTEAGMPAISDPGFELVAAVLDAGHDVVPVPGASAVLAALTVSGLPAKRFTFVGFLPRRKGERHKLLESLRDDPATLVIFESPHRLHTTLTALRETLGGRRIAVCRELTKLHEEVFRGTIGDAIAHFTGPRGEFTLVVEGATGPTDVSEADIIRELRRLRDAGASARDATTEVARELGVSRREAYRLWLGLGDNA